MTRVRKHPHAGMSGARRDFVKLVHDLVRDGGRNHREVFNDFLELAFCALAKTTRNPESARAVELEARYMRIAAHREPAYMQCMPELLGIVHIGLEDPCDFLGGVAGELGSLSEGLGQFFTPFELSRLLAELTLSDVESVVAEHGFVTMDEPACGAGGMVLACAWVLRERGIDPGECMFVRATDLSTTAYQMAYVQLSLAGIPADVFNANTLTLETFGAEQTSAKFPFTLRHGERFARWYNGERDTDIGAAEQAAARTPEQTGFSFDGNTGATT